MVRLSLRRVFFKTNFWVIYLYVNKSYSEILKSLDKNFKKAEEKIAIYMILLHDEGEALRF